MSHGLLSSWIYRLPELQREIFAIVVGDEYYLYDAEFGAMVPPRYIVHADGKIFNWFGEMSPWTIDDLIDTGRTRTLMK